MKLYLLQQNEFNGSDTYDSVGVCAKSRQAARRINPGDWGDNWASPPGKVIRDLSWSCHEVRKGRCGIGFV